MQVNHFELPDLGLCSPLISNYIESAPKLQPFVAQLPSAFDWKRKVQERGLLKPKARATLVDSLLKRYQKEGIDLAETQVQANLQKLKQESTYTVTTGHQLNLFTGPAYFIYKIINTIKLAEKLSAELDENDVLPVFWMASEDHDWDEVNHTHVYGQLIQSENTFSGPVGRQPSQGVEQLLESLKTTLRWDSEHPDLKVIERSVNNHKGTWSSLTFHLVHSLFRHKGLLILDADDPELKGLFRDVLKKELFEREAEPTVISTSSELEKIGGAAQVHPRPINLFYMTDQMRERLVFDQGQFQTADLSHSWSKEEITKIVQNTPEVFSPNVVLRPVYQEFILPNLAYVGGPGELSYWLQLKGVFDQYQVSFPNLILRNHAVLLDAIAVKRMNKFNFSIKDLFTSQDDMIRTFIQKSAEVELSDHIPALTSIINDVRIQASNIDPTLTKAVEASGQRMINELNQLEKRLQKAVKQSEETAVNQIRKLHASVFPDQILQERYQNYFALNQMSHGKLMETCFEVFDPVAMNISVLSVQN